MGVSCSNKEYLASLSVGVIRSKLEKSDIFPHLLATWLSATLNFYVLATSKNLGIVKLLNIPCLKSE